MNKVILMGRLTRDPEVRYSQGSEPLAVARYTIAVNRRFKRQGEADADFVPCVAFGKSGEFAEKYFKKGQMVGVVGRIQVRSWDDQEGKKRWTTEVVVEEQHFAESRAASEAARASAGDNFPPQQTYSAPYEQSQPKTDTTPSTPPNTSDGFYPINESIEDEDLPF